MPDADVFAADTARSAHAARRCGARYAIFATLLIFRLFACRYFMPPMLIRVSTRRRGALRYYARDMMLRVAY